MTSAIRENPVRQRLGEGSEAYGVFAAEFFTPGFCQIAAGCGAELAIFDQEHGAVGVDTLKAQIASARGAGIRPLRPRSGPRLSPDRTGPRRWRDGNMVPMIETAEQAEDLAKWCRYHPEGVRGLGFGAGHDDYDRGDVAAKKRAEKRRTLVIVLVETATGIRNSDAILAVPGIDVGWLWHYDSSNTMGLTAAFDHPEFEAAVETLLARATATARRRRSLPERSLRLGRGAPAVADASPAARIIRVLPASPSGLIAGLRTG